jgi:predicted transcriptional regulator
MALDNAALLLSVRPRFARLLLDGSKTVELRRVRPGVAEGSLVLIYASSPTRTLVGTARVAGVQAASTERIWQQYGPETGVTRGEYDEYFTGVDTAVAISLVDVHPLELPRPLHDLRRRLEGFRPPQSFRYLDSGQVAALI